MHDDLVLSVALAAWWSMQCAGDSFEEIQVFKTEDIKMRDAEIAHGLQQKELQDNSENSIEDWSWRQYGR
jgi:hypothetical protein